MVSITPFRPTNRKIMQRCAKHNLAWSEFSVQRDDETLGDLEARVERLRQIFPAHEFVIR